MRFILLIIFLGVAISSLTEEDLKPFETIQEVIQSIEKSKGHFDPSFLGTVKDPYEFRKQMKKDFVFFTIHPLKGSMDMFAYEVCCNSVSNQFWILKTGGIAGVYILYGSGKIEKETPKQPSRGKSVP